MDRSERELLDAINSVGDRVTGLEAKMDTYVNGRFKDNERRLSALESNQRWVVLAVVGGFISATLAIILK